MAFEGERCKSLKVLARLGTFVIFVFHALHYAPPKTTVRWLNVEPDIAFLLDKIRSSLESLKDSLKEQTRTIHDAHEADRKTQQQIRSALSDLRVTDDEKRDNRTRHNQNFSIQVLLTIGTLGAFFSAAIYAGIAKDQLGEMKTATEKSEEALKIDQRAWVTVNKIEPNKECAWRAIIFRNSGKSPALNFQIFGAAEPVRKGVKPSEPEKLMPGKGIISPDGIFHSCVGDKQTDEFDWSKTDLVVHGRIVYDDIFSTGHWTAFCYSRSKDSEFTPCESGNEMDRNSISANK